MNSYVHSTLINLDVFQALISTKTSSEKTLLKFNALGKIDIEFTPYVN